jgi:hypothetical protein
MPPSTARNGAMELIRTICMYMMIWIHYYGAGEMRKFLTAPFHEPLGRIRMAGLVTFSFSINCMIGLSGYFGITSSRFPVRRHSIRGCAVSWFWSVPIIDRLTTIIRPE